MHASKVRSETVDAVLPNSPKNVLCEFLLPSTVAKISPIIGAGIKRTKAMSITKNAMIKNANGTSIVNAAEIVVKIGDIILNDIGIAIIITAKREKIENINDKIP